MANDVFDSLMTREPEPMRAEDQGRCMVVGVRAKDSAEIEAREVEYFNTRELGTGSDWPVGFFESADDELPTPLSKTEAAALERRYGISGEEWRELLRRKRGVRT